MMKRSGGWSAFGGAALCLLSSSCAIEIYPGQPGVRTNGFAKIDMEYLDEAGLWVYEVSYDRSPGGGGVEQIVTKLYPGAFTYTSNVRTNADGSKLRHKFATQGATVQMISLPKEGTVIIPPNSQVTVSISYDKSLDEVDDRNLSEDAIFKPVADARAALADLRWKWDILRAGEFEQGSLVYSITKLKFGSEELDLGKLQVATNLSQTGVSFSATAEQKLQLRDFINQKFPKGFRGKVGIVLSQGETIEMPLGINTIESMKANGTKVIVKDLNTPPAVEGGSR